MKAVCPINEAHSARVRKTEGHVRSCYCDDCKMSFKMVGPTSKQQFTYYELPPRKVVKAFCPIDPEHHATVKSTVGRARYCYCDDCDRTFKMIGPSTDTR